MRLLAVKEELKIHSCKTGFTQFCVLASSHA